MSGVNRKEDRQINFRVDGIEYERLKKMADDKGISMGRFVRRKVLGIKTKESKIAHSDGVLIARELRKIGVNINQMAKRLNELSKRMDENNVVIVSSDNYSNSINSSNDKCAFKGYDLHTFADHASNQAMNDNGNSDIKNTLNGLENLREELKKIWLLLS